MRHNQKPPELCRGERNAPDIDLNQCACDNVDGSSCARRHSYLIHLLNSQIIRRKIGNLHMATITKTAISFGMSSIVASVVMVIVIGLALTAYSANTIAVAQQIGESHYLPISFGNSTQSTNNSTTPKEQQQPSASFGPSNAYGDLSSTYKQMVKSMVSVTGSTQPLTPAANRLGDENGAGDVQDDFGNSGSGSNESLNGNLDALGTGFVYDTKGHILTSYGVINGSQIQQVEFMDGSIYSAKVIGSDPYSDIAVLLVEGVPENKLIPVELRQFFQSFGG
jgi:S1-C subfamily serine protease